jgi:hypothetical protein
MALIALIAIDFAVIPALRHVFTASTRIGLFGALAMAHVLGFYLAGVVSSLVRRREVALSPVIFLLFGGTGMVLLVVIADLAPYFFWSYINNTAGLLPERDTIAGFGLGGFHLIRALLICVVVIVPLLIPGLLAGRATRGYRLRLVTGREAEGDSGREFVSEGREH